MFEWLFRKKTGENVNLLEVITASLNKLQLASLAEEKAVNMIANAIAKSEIVLSTGKERDRGLGYYRLNVAPNDNYEMTLLLDSGIDIHNLDFEDLYIYHSSLIFIYFSLILFIFLN